jgi:hypothetical protein
VPELGGYSIDNQRQVVELIDFLLGTAPQPPPALANKMATAARRLRLQADRRPLGRPMAAELPGCTAPAAAPEAYHAAGPYDDELQYGELQYGELQYGELQYGERGQVAVGQQAAGGRLRLRPALAGAADGAVPAALASTRAHPPGCSRRARRVPHAGTPGGAGYARPAAAAPEVHAAFQDSPELLQWVTGAPDDDTLSTFRHWAAQLQLAIVKAPPAAQGGGGCPARRRCTPCLPVPQRSLAPAGHHCHTRHGQQGT